MRNAEIIFKVAKIVVFVGYIVEGKESIKLFYE